MRPSPASNMGCAAHSYGAVTQLYQMCFVAPASHIRFHVVHDVIASSGMVILPKTPAIEKVNSVIGIVLNAAALILFVV